MTLLLARWHEFATWLDERSLRERLLFAASIGAAIFLLADASWLQPQAREQAGQRLAELAEESARLTRELALDPSRALAERRSQLESELAALDEELSRHTVGLISPEQMITVLRDLVRDERGLELVELSGLRPRPLFEESDGQDEVRGARIYQHGVRVVLRGSSAGTLAYLRAIEGLDWEIFWDQLHYRVERHPEASIELEVHTLSTGEGALRV